MRWFSINPGHAFASDAELLTPGDKEVRNQLIRTAFRMVGFGEQGGAGIPAMMRGWQQLGYMPPRIRNDKEQRSFEVAMLRELLLSDEQLYFQASLGVSLTNEEARLFVVRNSSSHSSGSGTYIVTIRTFAPSTSVAIWASNTIPFDSPPDEKTPQVPPRRREPS